MLSENCGHNCKIRTKHFLQGLPDSPADLLRYIESDEYRTAKAEQDRLIQSSYKVWTAALSSLSFHFTAYTLLNLNHRLILHHIHSELFVNHLEMPHHIVQAAVPLPL